MEFGAGVALDLIKSLLSLIGKWRKKTPPEEILRKRKAQKLLFEQNYDRLHKSDIIIRDIRRLDTYPDHDDKGKGISAWFKLEFKSLYHKGVELFMMCESVMYNDDENSWRICRYDEAGAVPALLVGKIPYEAIVDVEWNGDEYYPFPHLFCDFTTKDKMPYDELVFVVSEEINGREFFTEIGSQKDVRGSSKQGIVGRITSAFSRQRR